MPEDSSSANEGIYSVKKAGLQTGITSFDTTSSTADTTAHNHTQNSSDSPTNNSQNQIRNNLFVNMLNKPFNEYKSMPTLYTDNATDLNNNNTMVINGNKSFTDQSSLHKRYSLKQLKKEIAFKRHNPSLNSIVVTNEDNYDDGDDTDVDAVDQCTDVYTKAKITIHRPTPIQTPSQQKLNTFTSDHIHRLYYDTTKSSSENVIASVV